MSLGITTIADTLHWERIDKADREYIKDSSFTIYPAEESKLYVEPFLSIMNGRLEDNPQILLISCSGAVGKTAMSRYLSGKFNMPIFDLAIHKAVGDSTMTGILAREYQDLSAVKQELSQGRETIIIDALDEGLLKVSTDGYHAFLDDVIKITKDCDPGATPFVMTGRPNVAFETAQYLEDNHISCLWLQIEPFSISQANTFIDNMVLKKHGLPYSDKYTEAKNLIISSIECFFNRQSDCNNKNYVNFIGYAPVLLAIARMFEDNRNFQNIINRLNASGYKNIRLLIDIIQTILDREKNEKVFPKLVENIISKRDEDFKQLVRKKVYDNTEQCARILSSVLGLDLDIKPVDDPAFLAQYSEQISTFADEHPFLEDHKIQNVVFESFILATLATSDDYSILVEEYVERNMLKNSFALFPIFANICGKSSGQEGYDPEAAIKAIPAYLSCDLAESFNSINSKNITSEVILESFDEDEYKAERLISADFIYHNIVDRRASREFNLLFYIPADKPFSLGRGFSNTTISGDIDIIASGERVLLLSPISIDCDKFTIACSELQIIGGEKETVNITAETCEIDSNGKTYPAINTFGAGLSIHTESKPPYPANKYISIDPAICKQKPYDKRLFHKIRRLLLSFCCDSKGQGNWAKHKGKIDSRFSRDLGKKALEIMKENGIIYSDNFLYKINVPELEKKLGVKYDNLSSCRPSEKMIDFLNQVAPIE